MKVIVHDLLHGSQQNFEGDRITVFRQIAEEYPWHAEYLPPTDLEQLLANLDCQQFLAVEVTDDSEHPLA